MAESAELSQDDNAGAAGALDHATGALIAAQRAKVVAALARHFRDVDMAEEAFQDAALRAVKNWPQQGNPRDPAAWLIMVGRNAIIDRLRKQKRFADYARDNPAEENAGDQETLLAEEIDLSGLRDDVLRLMFMCCHEELAVTDQLALALKVIVGFPVDKIARALMIKPKAMEQRITRAKKKAAAVATRLDTPMLQERAHRLEAVSTMVYLLFNEGYSAGGGDLHIRTELCEEAIRLGRLLLEMFPAQPEVMGLLALCLLQHSRWRARMDEDGGLIPLADQDRSKWDGEAITEGKVLLEKALMRGRPGIYQIQAAIAATHCSATDDTSTDWSEIANLYSALYALQPTPIVALNRAVAIAKTEGEKSALDIIEPLAGQLDNYLYFHSTRASMLAAVGRTGEARAAYDRALELEPTTAERDHIEGKIARLEN
ncbi:MAG: RNA polymerase sigma factor [Rhizobiaceae bacterium]